MSDGPLYVGPLIHLRTLPAFAGLTPAQLRDLAYEVEEVVLQRGSMLIQRGESADAMYLIVDGKVAAGSETVGPGGAVGFLDMLAPGPTTTGARAESDVVALRLETDALREVCEQNFWVLGALLSYVAGQISLDREALGRAISGAPGTTASEAGALDRVGRILALNRTSAFSSESMDALAELAGHVDVVRVAAGRGLWEPGEVAGEFFVICSGTVRSVADAGGEPVELGPGSVPGLVETLAQERPAYEMKAVEGAVLLRVGVDPFMDVIEDHFEMAFGLLGWLAGHLRGTGTGTRTGPGPAAN